MFKNGYVMLHRSILQWRWYTNPNTRIVFEHLILTANWEDTVWQNMTIKRGQRVCKLETLADETGLSLKCVRTALVHLKSTNEVASQKANCSGKQCSVFTVINYDKYQSFSNDWASEWADKGQTKGRQTADNRQQINKNNNINNNNNAKKEGACAQEKNPPADREKACFSGNVFLTDAQYGLLTSEHGFDDTCELVKMLSRYKAETGKVYESDYHAIKTWVVKKLAEERQKKAEEALDPYYGFTLDDFAEKPPD